MNAWQTIQKFGKLLNNHNQYDAILITNSYSIKHFVNQSLMQGFLFINKNDNLDLFTSFFETPFLKGKDNLKIHELKQKTSTLHTLRNYIKDKGYKKIAFEGNDVTLLTFKFLIEKLNVEIIPIDLSQIRSIKNEEQIKKLKFAAKAIDNVFLKTRNYIKKERTNLTEIDVDRFIRKAAIDEGGEVSFNVIVASGKNGKYPHAIPTKKNLQENELITIDCGIKIDSYCSDMTRMLSLGKPSFENQKIYNEIIQSQKQSYEAIKEGISFFKLHQLAIESFKQTNHELYYVHSIGHGIGQEVHEAPYPRKDSKDSILYKNQVITIEPGLYGINNTGGRIEDMFLVTSDGYEQLTQATKELII